MLILNNVRGNKIMLLCLCGVYQTLATNIIATSLEETSSYISHFVSKSTPESILQPSLPVNSLELLYMQYLFPQINCLLCVNLQNYENLLAQRHYAFLPIIALNNDLFGNEGYLCISFFLSEKKI